MSHIRSAAAGLLGLLLVMCSNAAAQEAASPAAAVTLPGGASSLNEQHGDWSVACVVANNARQCALSQALVSRDNGQHVLSIELVPLEAGARLEGTLVMPFNLRFADGVTLAVDENAASQPAAFFTCMEIGCLVPVTFNTAELVALRSGTELVVNATATNGQPVSVKLSLAGITAAINRTVDLLK